MSTLKNQVGHLLKKARKEKGLTQKELSERLGVTPTTIKRYEMGVQNLTLDTIEKIAVHLDIEIQMVIK